MKLLTKEELAALELRPQSKKHYARVCIEKMKPGEVLLISRKDFNWKRKTPATLFGKLRKQKKNFIISNLVDKSGWVVERIK